MEVDECGWATGAVLPLDAGEAWTLLAPEPGARIDGERWAHHASRFFRTRLEVVQAKRYPSGTVPLADAADVDVAPRDDELATRVRVVSLPLDRAPALRAAAAASAAAIGGAGFDALVARGRQLWQVKVAVPEGGDSRAPLALAAILAATLLAPVMPPGGGAIFGVKGARERLERLGWRT